MKDSTKRFTERVQQYARHRPGYPAEVMRTLSHEYSLVPSSIVSDIGSGTGILTRMFLDNGNTVYAVEPNPDMRRAAENSLGGYAGFHSVSGTAEHTSLPVGSIDFLTAAQAFHWFDRGKAKGEFRRILKPDGLVVLLWNERDTTSSAFLREYERLLLTFGTDYREVDHRKVDQNVVGGFLEGGHRHFLFEQTQTVDFEGLKGRLLSSSYVPNEDDPECPPMLEALGVIFRNFQRAGRVTFVYRTQMYCGRLS